MYLTHSIDILCIVYFWDVKSVFFSPTERPILYYSETLKNEYIGRFIKCRLDNFSMIFILYYVNFSICENK